MSSKEDSLGNESVVISIRIFPVGVVVGCKVGEVVGSALVGFDGDGNVLVAV